MSSTPLPPPTEEQMEEIKGAIRILARSAYPPLETCEYLAVLAEGLRPMKFRVVEDGGNRAMDWCFATEMRRVREGAAFDAMWQPVEKEVGDDE